MHSSLTTQNIHTTYTSTHTIQKHIRTAHTLHAHAYTSICLGLDGISCVSVYVHHRLSCHWASLSTVWLPSPFLPISTYQYIGQLPYLSLLQGEQSELFQPFLLSETLQCPHHHQPFAGLFPVWSCLLLYWGVHRWVQQCRYVSVALSRGAGPPPST